jgi:hypothetical protein
MLPTCLGAVPALALRRRLPWRRAWADLMLPRLDRVTRHFAWRLLPADDGLRCGAATLPWQVPDLPELQAAVCCSICGADGGQIESLSHAFLQCPTVRPAAVWLHHAGRWECTASGCPGMADGGWPALSGIPAGAPVGLICG